MTALLVKMVLACLPVALFVLLAVAMEFAWPRERGQSASRFPGAVWLVVQPALITLAGYPVMMLWKHLGVGPLVDLTPLGYWGGAIVALIVFDFLRYATHRFEHRFWWPFHAVHHSIRELHAANSYTHPFEGLAEVFLVVIPLSLFQVSPDILLLVGAVSGFQNVIIHSPLGIHLGPLRALFVDSRFHRIHHSVAPEHHDRNFGFLFSFWDRLFGTLHQPQPGEWPATGVDELAPPRTYVGLLLHPLQHFRTAGSITRTVA